MSIDDDLIARLRTGDLRAGRDLFQRYRRPVRCLALRLTRNEPDVAEVEREIFSRALHHLGDYHAGTAFSTWLYRLTVEIAVARFVDKRRASLLSADCVTALDLCA